MEISETPLRMPRLSQPRETGIERAQVACSNCGGPVPLVQTQYGSTAVGACPKCWPVANGATSSPSQLAAQQLAAAQQALDDHDEPPDEPVEAPEDPAKEALGWSNT